MTENSINETTSEDNLEKRLDYTNFKAFAGLMLTGVGAYLLGTDLPPDIANHQLKAYQMLSYGSLIIGAGLSISSMQSYNDMINPKK